MDFSNINWGRLLTAGLVAAIVLFACDILIHGLFLSPHYMEDYTFARGQEGRPEAAMWAPILRLLIWGLMMTWIYTYGVHPGKPGWQQGLRYGLVLGFFYWSTYGLLEFVILPIPFWYVPVWTVLGALQAGLAGMAIGTIYKTKAQTLLAGDA